MFNYDDYDMFCRLNRISKSKVTSLRMFAKFVGHKSKHERAGEVCV